MTYSRHNQIKFWGTVHPAHKCTEYKLVRLHTCFQYRVIPFLVCCWPWLRMGRFRETWYTNSSDNFRLIQPFSISYEKKLKEVNFVDNEFLHEKKNNKNVYVDHGATEKSSKDACSSGRMYIWQHWFEVDDYSIKKWSAKKC